MSLQIEPRHDLSLDDIDAIEERLYEHNSHATGRHDGRGLGFVQQRTCGDCTAMPVSCQFHIKREKLRARGFDLDDNLTGRHLLAFCDIDGGNRA